MSKLVKIEGTKVHLQGLDLLDGTPILDIKPYIPNYDCPVIEDPEVSGDKYLSVQDDQKDLESPNQDKCTVQADKIKVPDWIANDKYLSVQFTDRAMKELHNLNCKNEFKNPKDIIEAIKEVLEEDPRSNYRKDKCTDKLYFFNVDYVKVTCWFDDDFVQVLKVSA